MSESIVSYFCRALYLVCQLSCLPISLSLSLSLSLSIHISYCKARMIKSGRGVGEMRLILSICAACDSVPASKYWRRFNQEQQEGQRKVHHII